MIETIIVLMVIVAILLVIVILIQNPKGGGLSSEFGGGSTQMFGVQKTGDILEKLSWGFFTFLLVAALSTAIIIKVNSGSGDAGSDVNVESSVAIPSAATPAPSSAAPAAAPVTAPAQNAVPTAPAPKK